MSADQMLVFIYKLLQGSADIATLSLSQRRDMTDYTPVTDRVLKETFISGLQNYALQGQSRSIIFSRTEIANGEEVPVIMREAESLVRDGVFSKYGDARMEVQMHQDLGSASVQDHQGHWNRSSAFLGFCSNHKPQFDQQREQAILSRNFKVNVVYCEPIAV
ncbi:hypothetical protein HF325_002278 [Metschnikowia pulcherrima]|uniref:Uncharacterized protein n=1 Tax=Metschnikowia pulcherrima TaxID=27326 RepID=A0A8H7GTE6_9ASCO|nr:hypothetical protein HF325_002278 [Metschnikowia pulcherrima]